MSLETPSAPQEQPKEEPRWFQPPQVNADGSFDRSAASKSESDYQDPPEYVGKVAACKTVVDRITAYGTKPETEEIYKKWCQKRDQLIVDLAEALGSRKLLEESRTYHILTYSTPEQGTIKVFDAAGSDEILDFIMNYENRNGLPVPEPEPVQSPTEQV